MSVVLVHHCYHLTSHLDRLFILFIRLFMDCFQSLFFIYIVWFACVLYDCSVTHHDLDLRIIYEQVLTKLQLKSKALHRVHPVFAGPSGSLSLLFIQVSLQFVYHRTLPFIFCLCWLIPQCAVVFLFSLYGYLYVCVGGRGIADNISVLDFQ